jgi:predicted GIY-YIG superfamily endonuclease
MKDANKNSGTSPPEKSRGVWRDGVCCVYALVDPTNDEVFYVGYTKQSSLRRFSQHKETRSRGGNGKKVKVRVATIQQRGEQPEMLILEKTKDTSREQFWIKYLNRLGALLLNIQTQFYTSLSTEGKKQYHKEHYDAWKQKNKAA